MSQDQNTSLDITEQDLKNAITALERAVAEFDEQCGQWKSVANQSVSTWNPSILHAGQNVGRAARHFMRVSYPLMPAEQSGFEFFQGTLDIVRNRRDIVVAILDRGVRGESSSAYRTNVLIALESEFNETVFHMKTDFKAHKEAIRPKVRKVTLK